MLIGSHGSSFVKTGNLLPYDYAVEYVQADVSVSRSGNVYIPFGVESLFLGDTNKTGVSVRVECDCSVHGSSGGSILVCFGHRATSASPKINSPGRASETFATLAGVGPGAARYGVQCSSLDDYRHCVTTMNGSSFTLYIDDENRYSYTLPDASTLPLWRLSGATNPDIQEGTWCALGLIGSTLYDKQARVKTVALYRNSIPVVLGTPCVKGDMVGWYNSVDGSLNMISMTDYPMYSPGPRI